MNLGRSFIEALASLASNKLRSALTILGIVIGVGAVIALISVGRGAESSISDQINSIGTNLLYINAGAQDVRNPRPLTIEDANALKDPILAPSVLYAAPVIQSRGEVSQRGESITTSLLAVTPEYAIVRSVNVAEGSFITQDQLKARAAVIVLGSDVALGLYGTTTNVIGKTVRIQGQPFRVISVLESVGGSNFGSQDDQVLIPLTTAQSRLVQRGSRDQVDTIYVSAVSSERVSQAVDEVTAILASRHRVSRNQPDFNILNQQDILQIAQTITGTFTIFLGGIAAISLLVGGIGIMNIMLVTVTERTREIGLRKALGARKRDILWQFLTESAVLSLLGGIIGIILGWGISIIIGKIAANSGTPFNPSIGVDTIMLATLFSSAIGLFFGIYPANRAARLQPVEALRYE
jgi:putative ABC transport system permease protein